jgi:hypothetical protein
LQYPDSDAALRQALADWSAGGAPTGEHRQTVSLTRDWLDQPDTQAFEATYRFRRESWGAAVSVETGGMGVDLDAPVELASVVQPKPWGREIWYTGIERRGECGVRVAGGCLPLSAYLALAPDHLVRRRPMVLLKILDPYPEPERGDLYFEVHREKREVYVVTAIDRSAWPNGVGGIRFGMDQALRAHYGNDATFRAQYLQAVERYAGIRRRIDAGEPVPPADEATARGAMERFTSMRPLRVGDVVAVPPWLPHSLQHGVRVVEFQTPTYERLILSFGQRVLTQAHWDTAAAVPHMTIDTPPEPALEPIADGVERIAAFDQFSVWRVALAGGGRFALPGHAPYALCMTVEGRIRLASLELAAEHAALVPGATLADPRRRERLATVHNAGPGPATFLIAAPEL